MSQTTSRTPIDPRPQPAAVGECSIAGALDALGDVWSILVLRELFFGVHRFSEMLIDLGISRSVLTSRLNRLVELGVVKTEPYQEPGDRIRKQYRLTRKGVRLLPVMVGLMEWGDEYVNPGAAPVTLRERESGDEVHVELRTASGQRVEPNQLRVQRTGLPRSAPSSTPPLS